MRHILEIPFTPPSLNRWERSRSLRIKTKAEWFEYIWGLCNEAGKKIPQYEKVKLSAKIHFPDPRKRDPDNFSATLWKLVCDALVNAGVIADDTSDHVEISIPELIYGTKRKTEIVIEGEIINATKG